MFWNHEGFTNEELKGLLLVYEKINSEHEVLFPIYRLNYKFFQDIKADFSLIDNTIQNISEPLNRLKDIIEKKQSNKIQVVLF